MSFLSKDVHIAPTNIQENIAGNIYQKIKLLDIVNYNGFPNAYENVFCLGITQVEFNRLKDTGASGNTIEFSKKHHRYIYIEEVIGSPFTDKDGKPYRKFKVKVQGLKNNGEQVILAPSENDTPLQDIYVYNQLGLVFSSKDFAEQETNQLGLVYIRNYEEKIGYTNVEPTTKKHYEDYFIENINPNMKTEVEGFINTLATIANDENAFQNIKTLVEDSAKDIFDEAVSFVQANSNANPDDRPLYWARNKMQVALKSHPYFENQFLYSNVIAGSELEKMIQLFEEKSRNYIGVDFSYATQNNLKKILITGFDPFFLNPSKQGHNIKQSNPSGVCALALHDKILGNGYVQTMIIPVRYTDFDGSNDRSKGNGSGVIEKYVAQFIGHALNQADIIITISQSGIGNYNIDRFSTINRGGSIIDNLGFYREVNSDSVKLNNKEDDLKWIETTLPKAMVMNGGAYQQADNWKHYIVYAQHYSLANDEASAIPESPIYDFSESIPFDNFTPDNPGQIFTTDKKVDNLIDINNIKKRIIDGSGGNYLSNEIFYRVALARERWQRTNPSELKFPTGHFHVAYIQQSKKDLTGKYFFSNRTIYDELTKLIQTVKERIILGVNNLNDLF
jgi:pyrrolidone-carboxylate peptidase